MKEIIPMIAPIILLITYLVSNYISEKKFCKQQHEKAKKQRQDYEAEARRIREILWYRKF